MIRRQFWLFLGLWLGIVALALSLWRFYALIPSVVGEPNPNIQAAIVLTGDSGRVQASLDLFNDKQIKHLFISGVYQGLQLPELLKVLGEKQTDEICSDEACIELGHAARDTRGNAKESLAWLKKRQIKRVYLITSDYHLPRSQLEFQTAFAKAGWHSELIGYPITQNRLTDKSLESLKNWGRVWGREYLKWLAANLRVFLENFLKQ